MQDRYAGDTPDFGKYVLLWHFQHATGLRLGVNWYRTRPEEVDIKENKDGGTRHHARLPTVFENVAPDIYENLRQFENDENRCIEKLENAGLFKTGTCFFSEFLSFGKPRLATASKIRHDWCHRAKEKLKDIQLVFCDPDTGPSPQSMLGKSHYKIGPKYAYPEEISAYLKAGQSVIVIRFIRQYRGGVERCVRDTFQLLKEQNAIENTGFALEFPSGRNSTYFILPAADHEDALRCAVDAFVESRAGQLFQLHSGFNRGR